MRVALSLSSAQAARRHLWPLGLPRPVRSAHHVTRAAHHRLLARNQHSASPRNNRAQDIHPLRGIAQLSPPRGSPTSSQSHPFPQLHSTRLHYSIHLVRRTRPAKPFPIASHRHPTSSPSRDPYTYIPYCSVRKARPAGTFASPSLFKYCTHCTRGGHTTSRTRHLLPTIATMSKVMRSMKNVTKGYSAVQVKVRDGRTASNSLDLYQYLTVYAQLQATTHGDQPEPKCRRFLK